MIKVEHIVTPSSEQMEFVIQGMRNPYNSWDKSDSGHCGGEDHIGCVYCSLAGDKAHNEKMIDMDLVYRHGIKPCGKKEFTGEYVLGHNDHELMLKLAKAGTDHRKFMRQMPLMMRITAPLYFWKEFDTYKIGTVSNSCSTMHTIAAKEFTHEDFSINKLAEITGADLELLDEYRNLGNMESVRCDLARYRYYFNIDDTIFNLNFARSLYMAADKNLKRGDLTDDEKKHIAAQKKKFWWQMIQLLPNSYNQTRNIVMNYEVLANIYASRKNHKLDEWVQFCKLMEGIPYFDIVKAGCDKRTKSGDTNDENSQI